MNFYYPPGIILPFDTACPADWTRMTALDAKFVKGNAAYGTTGGSNDHKHTADFGVVYSAAGSGSGTDAASGSDNQKSMASNHKHFIPTSYKATSNAAVQIPPYINVIFCKKD